MNRSVITPALILIIFGLSPNISMSQTIRSKSDINEYMAKLPSNEKDKFVKEVDKLAEENRVDGVMEYKQFGTDRKARYKLLNENGKIGGTIKVEVRGTPGRLPNDKPIINIVEVTPATMYYCCKDSTHNPHHSCAKQEDIPKVKQENKCTKFGVCFIE